MQPNSRYKVTIGGKDYVITDASSHAVNELVEIMIPQNDYDRMFIMPAGGAIAAANSVVSVNGKTGNVVVSIADITSLPAALDGKVDKNEWNSYRVKLDGIAAGANNYIHPDSHPADMIAESGERQFVSRSDKDHLADLMSKRHVHGNKSILDGIDQSVVDYWNDKLTRKEADEELTDRVGKAYLLWEEHGDGEQAVYTSGEIIVPEGSTIFIYSSAFSVNGILYAPGEDYRLQVVKENHSTARIEAEWLHTGNDSSGFALDAADQINIKVEYTFR